MSNSPAAVLASLSLATTPPGMRTLAKLKRRRSGNLTPTNTDATARCAALWARRQPPLEGPMSEPEDESGSESGVRERDGDRTRSSSVSPTLSRDRLGKSSHTPPSYTRCVPNALAGMPKVASCSGSFESLAASATRVTSEEHSWCSAREPSPARAPARRSFPEAKMERTRLRTADHWLVREDSHSTGAASEWQRFGSERHSHELTTDAACDEPLDDVAEMSRTMDAPLCGEPDACAGARRHGDVLQAAATAKPPTTTRSDSATGSSPIVYMSR